MTSAIRPISGEDEADQQFKAGLQSRSGMSIAVKRAQSEDKPASSGALPLLNERVLGMIRAQAPVPKILEVLCVDIEKQHPGLLCSVLLLDADGTTLRHGAAPGLPEEYIQAIDGTQIGPCAGSCG